MIYSISHHFHRGTQLWLLLDWSFRLKWCSQITNSGSVVGATRLGNSVAKKFQIQIIGRFNLQLDGEILHSRHDSCSDWYNVVSGSGIYHNNFFDQGFVTAETCSLHGADVGSEPGHEQELGSLAHFIAALNRDVLFHIPTDMVEEKEHTINNEWNVSFPVAILTEIRRNPNARSSSENRVRKSSKSLPTALQQIWLASKWNTALSWQMTRNSYVKYISVNKSLAQSKSQVYLSYFH